MGRKRKSEDATPTPTNGYDKDKVAAFVERIENLHADIATEMATALNACRQIHGDIKVVYQEAKDEAGIPKKALKKVIKARALERKAAECREELEGDAQDSYDLIRQALGELADTPLGRAAMPNGGEHVPTSGPGTPTDPAVMAQVGRGPQ